MQEWGMRLRRYVKIEGRRYSQSRLRPKEGFRFEDDNLLRIKEKIESDCDKLKTIGEYRMGIQTACNEVFIIDEVIYNTVKWNEIEKTMIHPCVTGKTINIETGIERGDYIIVIPKGWTNENRGSEEANQYVNRVIPNIIKHFILKGYTADTLYTRTDQGDYWWELRAFSDYKVFDTSNVIWSRISKTPKFTLTSEGDYCTNSVSIIKGENLEYLIPIMNSKIAESILKLFYSIDIVGGIIYAGGESVMETPIPRLTEEQKEKIIFEPSEGYIKKLYNLTEEEAEYLLQAVK